MSTETTVKKRTRSKKVAKADEVVVADNTTFAEVPTKKTKTRKAVSKPLEDDSAVEVIQTSAKSRKPREVKKKEASKTTSTVSTSKLAAKTSGNELQQEDPPNNASQILKQATAFAEERRETTKDAAEPPVRVDHDGESLKATVDIADPMSPAAQSGKLGKANTKAKALSELELTDSALRLPVKPSLFLNSFFNHPEPGPVHPPQEQQERGESSEEGRAGLKQANKHDFEDSILSPRGTVKAQPQPTSRPSSIPSAVAALMESSNAALSSARLRAFTTSSFTALKASSKSKATPSQATPSPSPLGSTAPSAPTTSSPQATPNHRKASSKPTPGPSTSPTKHSVIAQSSNATTSAPPRSKLTSIPRAYPSGSLPQSPARRPPPPTPSPRPTDLSYAQLQKNAQYKSLRRRWTATMVAIPFAVFSSYEIWRRWECGDIGRRRMERDSRVTVGNIEEELKGFDRSVAGGGGGGGALGNTTVKASSSERSTPTPTPTQGMKGGQSLLDEIPSGQKTDVVVAAEETRGMEAVSGRQQSSGAVAKDIEAGKREEALVLGRLPGLEMESGSTETRDLLREGGSKRGWVQVFR